MDTEWLVGTLHMAQSCPIRRSPTGGIQEDSQVGREGTRPGGSQNTRVNNLSQRSCRGRHPFGKKWEKQQQQQQQGR